MRRGGRWVLVVALAGCFGLAVAGAPVALTVVQPVDGVRIGRANWCGTGLCLHEVQVAAPSLAIAHVGVDWDGRVRLVGVRTGAADPDGAAAVGVSGIGDADTSTLGRDPAAVLALLAALPGQIAAALPPGVTAVSVIDLTGPAPLPVLSGSLYPMLALDGEGVRITSEGVWADITSPDLGRIRATLSLVADEPEITAQADAVTVPATLLGAPLILRDLGITARQTAGLWAGQVSVGGLTLPFEAAASPRRLTLRLERTSVAALYDALQPLIPEARASIAGTLSATVVLTDDADGMTLTLDDPVLDGFRVSGLVGDDLRSRFSYPTLTPTGTATTRVTGPDTPGWLPLTQLGPTLPAAVIAAEDASFGSHPGYDLTSMLDAFDANTEQGRVRRGGSTLTQQLAKNLFLDGERTYVRKLRELLYAVNLEGTLGKRGILETYLNIVEFGPGLYGCGAATEQYFLKSPAGLLPEEAAWLASILPSPRSAWTQQYQRNRPNLARVHGILDNMLSLSDAERTAAKARGVNFVR